MAEYKCTENFSIELYDSDGFPTEEYKEIDIGTIWYRDDESNIIGGEIHLESTGDLGWLEISLERLQERFELLEVKQNG